MSHQVAVCAQSTFEPVLFAEAEPLDLCGRIYERNYAAHQETQQSICEDWTALLLAE